MLDLLLCGSLTHIDDHRPRAHAPCPYLLCPWIMAIRCESVSQANAFLQESPRGSSSETAALVNFPVSKFLVQGDHFIACQPPQSVGD